MGGIDVVIISAGVGGVTPIDTTTLGEFRRICDGNVLPVFLACRYALPYLRRSDRGAIIVISSMFGVVGYRDRVAYCASKAAVIGMVKALALDLAPYRITVNAICPGFIDTELARVVLAQEPDPDAALVARAASTPMGRVGRTEEIGALAVHLASDGAAWTTGQQFIVDGGYTAQ
jgi:NAD(P)-dependent dehydrogenase (short-subunit alcohol dehydrogenase family)